MDVYKRTYMMKNKIEALLKKSKDGLTEGEIRYNLTEFFVGNKAMLQHLKDLIEVNRVSKFGEIYTWNIEIEKEIALDNLLNDIGINEKQLAPDEDNDERDKSEGE